MKHTDKNKHIPEFKLRYMVAATGLSGVVTILALRSNYETMVSLRSAVFKADEQNADVETALRDLREHIYNHMNTSLNSGSNTIYPPIQLKYRYDRLVAEQKLSGNNSQVYSDAQASCEQNNQDFSGRGRVTCIEEYVKANGGTPQAAIPESLYKFDFVSPRWSPDVAGWGIVITSLLLIATVFTAVVRFRRKRSS